MSIQNLSKKHKQAIYLISGLIVIAIISALIVQIYKSSNEKKMLEASTLYQKALIASENSNSSLSTKTSKFEAVINKYPNSSFGIFSSWQLADLYITPTKLNTSSFNINIANVPKAIDVLQKSISSNPNDNLTDITKTRLARLYILTKDPDQAIKILQSTDSLQKNAYPLMILGQAYIEKGEKTKAIQTWEKALQDPNNSEEFRELITQQINNSN